MGRVLETLKQAEARRAAPRVDTGSGEPADHLDDALDSDANVPFIEVGPKRMMDASADVLACGPASVAPPESAPGAELADCEAPEGAVSRQYRELLAVLSKRLPQTTAHALLFTATAGGAGTTTVLLNLAVTAAREEGRRVLVVDANLRRPAVAERLGLRPAPGLREVLGGVATLEQAVQATGRANLFALTAGLAGAGPGPRFLAETLRSVLRQARQRFHLILVDGAPWDGRGDAMAAGAACDVVFVVVPEADVESSAVDALLQVIPEQGGRLGGCIAMGR
jgi:Mrp family chromosome partitioning ATPase